MKEIELNKPTRRRFLKTAGSLSGAFFLPKSFNKFSFYTGEEKAAIPVYAHLWVYASRYPPDWDCTPIMDVVFSDLKYAGLQGVEIMEIHLRRKDAVERF